ncbi:ATP-binding protein, partial [Pseudoalteromonas sp. BSi20652]|uniref:ATP-binding protein n=3 Tax=unclassified Pseudoalteromonas TaxID=194690 RepID=UPI000518A4D1
MNISQKNKDNFFNLVDSLKKCRRADLSDVSKSKDVIEKLYVDPLDNDLILKSISKLNTTILTGRRGTGKSTIIARLQHDIRKSKDRLSLYIDVKSIFEQSKAFSYSAENYADHFSAQDLNKYLIYKSFLKEIISEIKLELKTNTLKFYLAKITDYFGPDKTAFEEELNRIFDDIEKFEYMDVEVLKQKKVLSNEENKNSVNQKISANVSVDSTGPKGSFNAEHVTSNSDASSLNEEFSEVLLKCFNPILIMRSIRELLKNIGINHVFICLDDFSEIDYDAMKIFVDVIIGPLNNLSDEFFKFKIAAYPGRIYLGDIDPQKIEQIRLDFYELYQAKTITDVHAQAEGSIKKLIEKRTQFFCKQTPDEFFDTTKATLDDYYKTLFDITSCVPRNVGWILWYANQQSIAKDKKITLNDLSIAAEKHFIDTVRPYFSQNQFMREPFDMKLEKYHLHQLLERFVESAKSNKRDILVSDSKVFAKDKT